jgi:hypothetical protein
MRRMKRTPGGCRLRIDNQDASPEAAGTRTRTQHSYLDVESEEFFEDLMEQLVEFSITTLQNAANITGVRLQACEDVHVCSDK